MKKMGGITMKGTFGLLCVLVFTGYMNDDDGVSTPVGGLPLSVVEPSRGSR